MRITKDTADADGYIVFMPMTNPNPDKPLEKYRIEPVGPLAAADNVEGWVDRYREDGTIERIHGDVSLQYRGMWLPKV